MEQQGIIQQLKESKSYLIALTLYAFLFLFFCSKMSPLYPTNEWADVNVYFNVGKGMFSGMTLYTDIFDHKGPLIFIIYGVGAIASESSFVGLFILQVVAWILAIWFTFLTAKIFLKMSTAFIVSLIAPIAFLSYLYNGGSAEEMALLLSIVSTYFFVSYFVQAQSKQHKPRYMFVHGVLTAMVFMIKLNLMLFWFFPLLAIFITLLWKKEYKNFLSNCAAYLGGFILVSLPIILYFVYNGALGEAFHVYIELNKQYSNTDNYSYLAINGFNKLYKEFRVHLVWYLVISVGVFYFPYKSFNTWIARTAFIFSGLSLFVIIFFPLTFHFYYPLPLFVFAGLGLIAIGTMLEKYIDIKSSSKLLYFVAAIMLLVAINQRNFFNLGAETLLRQREPDGPHYQFRSEIMKEKNPTLLNIAFGEGNSLFTTTGITPTEKYFFCPNIYYNMFPDIRDNQTIYIEEKRTQFIISSNIGFNYDYFQELEALKNNYTMIDSCVMMNDYVIDRFNTYYLYKRND